MPWHPHGPTMPLPVRHITSKGLPAVPSVTVPALALLEAASEADEDILSSDGQLGRGGREGRRTPLVLQPQFVIGWGLSSRSCDRGGGSCCVVGGVGRAVRAGRGPVLP